MTTLPDWLVERAALDEVGAASRARIDGADPRELAERIASIRTANAAELSSHPPGPAVALIAEHVAVERRRRTAARRRMRATVLGLAATCAIALFVVVRFTDRATPGTAPDTGSDDTVRVKGSARLLAFRLSGDSVESLEPDALVKPGDVIQLRYNAGGRAYGMIASIDGAGVVTLHYPASEDAAPAATAVAHETTALPNAYALDAAPRFERFFFLTSLEPIDVQRNLATLRAFARRDDCASATLELPKGLHQWSLRLRKPDRGPQ